MSAPLICEAQGCKKLRTNKCENRMCRLHCRYHNNNQGNCKVHNIRPSKQRSRQNILPPAKKEPISTFSISQPEPFVSTHKKSFAQIAASQSSVWSPPCLICSSSTHPDCQNALCDTHCLHVGKSRCMFHETSSSKQFEYSDIWNCARDNDIDGVKYWIEHKNLDVNTQDMHKNTALFYACLAGNINIVDFLLNTGAKDDAKLKRCWWNSTDPQIRNRLEQHYDQQYYEIQLNAAQNITPEQREQKLLEPVVRYLALIRKRESAPPVGSVRYQIEQIIPDELWQASFSLFDTNEPTSLPPVESIKQKSVTEIIRGAAADTFSDGTTKNEPIPLTSSGNIDVSRLDVEEFAFQQALSSLSSLRDSLEIKRETNKIKKKLDAEAAAKLCVWSLEDMLDMNSCKICFLRMTDIVNVPCGHMGYCSECIQSIDECPSCRNKIEQKVKLYRV